MIVAAIILSALFFALITAYFAGQRGYDVMTWYCLGLVLGPLGLGVLLLPRQRSTMETA